MKLIVGVPNYDLLPYLDKKVKEYDFNYAIHLHGPDMPLYPDADDVWENVKDLDPRIGMCLDIGHDRRNGKDPVADLEKYISRVFDIHLKDVTGASKAGYSVEVGRGILDIPGFVRMLRKTGYDGVVSLEHERNMKDPFIGIAESIGYFRGVVATTSDRQKLKIISFSLYLERVCVPMRMQSLFFMTFDSDAHLRWRSGVEKYSERIQA